MQLGLLESCWPYVRKRGWNAFISIRRASMAPTTSSRCSSTSNPAELCLPTLVLNTDIRAVINILKNEELIRPSKWCPWFGSRTGFYCRGSFDSSLHATQSAARHGGIPSSRPWCLGGTSMIRQQHVLVSRGGVLADTAAAHFHDLVRSREGRWKLRSTLAAPAYVAIFW